MTYERPVTPEDKAYHVMERLIPDLSGELLYYGRKEDDEMPLGEIEALVEAGHLDPEAMVARFRKELFGDLRPHMRLP